MKTSFHKLFWILIAVVLLMGLSQVFVRASDPVKDAASPGPEAPNLPGDEFWDDRFNLEGVSGTVYAVVKYFGNICIGGDFHQVGSLPAENIACWSTTMNTWSALGSGTSGPVYAIAQGPNDTLLVGGQFSQAGNQAAQNIARWNDVLDQWEALGAGTSGPVYALAVYGSPPVEVYAGGQFWQAGTVPANNLARWDDKLKTWSALTSGQSNGVSGPVHSLTLRSLVYSGGSYELYVGGAFNGIGGVSSVNAHNIARWNHDTQSWSEISGSVGGPVYAIQDCGSELIVGGQFSQAGQLPASNVAGWNYTSKTWSALGQGASNTVQTIDCIYNRVYVGGLFNQVGNVAANHVARWEIKEQSWAALGSGTSGPIFGLLIDTTTASNDVYVGGFFASAGSTSSHNFGRYTGDTYQYNPEDIYWDRSLCKSGLDNEVATIAASEEYLYYGGAFTQAGGVMANAIARYDSTSQTWSTLGAGVNGKVKAITVTGSDVYVGGDFSEAGGVAAANIARWNSVTGKWFSLGSGTSGPVRAIAVSNGGIIVGGDFATAGGVTVNNIARWEPGAQAWSPLGEGTWIGMNGPVNALATLGSDVYAAGSFTTAQDVIAFYIARWDGNVWSALGSGLNSHVYALGIYEGQVYVGGYFSKAGGSQSYGVARWDGAAWHAMPGLIPTVYALAFNQGVVYAGGVFNVPGGSTANGIAQWDGSQWSTLGSGGSGMKALAVGGNGLYVGGSFTYLAHLPCSYTSRWQIHTTPSGSGVISGHVHSPSGAGVSAARVQVCERSQVNCAWLGTSDTNGDFKATGLADGEYLVKAYPPQGLTALPGAPSPITISGGNSQLADIDLSAVTPFPSGATLLPSRQTAAGVPFVHWKQSTQLAIQGCTGSNATYQIVQNNAVLSSGPLSEGPPGNYHANLPPLYPASGYAQVSVNIPCTRHVAEQSTAFDLYIDPTGTVTDRSGKPVPGAQVTLFAFDPAIMSLVQVSMDDPRLSPANRANPDLTDAAGHFGWDVAAGIYVVRAEKEGCVSLDNPVLAYTQTDLETVPSEWADLDLRLDCAGSSGIIYLPLIQR